MLAQTRPNIIAFILYVYYYNVIRDDGYRKLESFLRQTMCVCIWLFSVNNSQTMTIFIGYRSIGAITTDSHLLEITYFDVAFFNPKTNQKIYYRNA